ncbi:hypothetical protein [Erwinia psidii]|uniref:Uncharacterized protein n=1 Tax=Erwinia psidii TaxID=69224 RepID=A0A3N6RXK9_9GAMM|nr:hypothetical protein [Erwinia psidii]MCX8958144.1 hypothetical protein [Erwinia psidii]RQM37127.1 hypothetical protein EB241_17155 [Erwinia psidii]
MVKLKSLRSGRPESLAVIGVNIFTHKSEVRLLDSASGDTDAEQAVAALYGCERLEDGQIQVTDATNRCFRRAFGKAGKHNNASNKKRK